ncbi:MAG: hypothetical protein ABH816_01330 [Candidatus Levyibacteriota bacterium]
MAKAAQKIHSSTQKFTEILDISENVVIFQNSYATLVIEIQATNFSLLSQEEQNSKIYAYASLLNSLSFPIQLIIRNKKIDVSAYVKTLDLELAKSHDSLKLNTYIKHYRDFILSMVKVQTILDKKFYLAIPYSYFEKGVKGVLKKDDFALSAKTALHTKAESLLTELKRLTLNAKILEKEELIKLFYDIYNHNEALESQIEQSLKTPIVKAK